MWIGVRAFAAACALSVAPLGTASAELINISAGDFQEWCTVECFGGASNSDVFDRGVLKPDDIGRFYASVPFPVNGQRVCSLSLIYQDSNANDPLVATLFRKRFSLGQNAYTEPVAMASVASAPGVSKNARRVTTRNIIQPTVQKANSFYYVEVFAETINLNFLGVQIDVRPTCPPP